MAIGRDECFSPNSVDKDAAILDCVSDALRQEGYDIATVSETALGRDAVVEAYVSMGRSARTLDLLGDKEASGAVVMNSAAGVALCCDRRRLTDVLRRAGVPVPAESGRYGYWLKKARGFTESRYDVQFASDEIELQTVKARMIRHGVDDIMVSAHVVGDLVKFYGVRGSRFFRFYYPGDDGQWKFGDEMRNGRPHYYAFDVRSLHDTVEHAAAVAGVDIYGGDCVIGSNGSFCIIDFNDWPSFSRCREEAAGAIARAVTSRMARGQIEKRA